ncbi:RdgB/HAM1 family non-canonical purine NTP pyrophosphatase [uncultured Mitsuokella sp.]|uniref:RdgB/HAM1 family non-canonical purine NTP pyrophosphatase n=1 Tax=uncultured Mitsuokella sp. TaxID=453120 RepID=UPI002600E229|nr:RdgB/HAM1 family non-canonical purine NTP pyrophosphatase [uncultured Mitsuokella sp.]
MKKIVIATKNQGKVREMREALSHLPVEVVSLKEFGELPDAVENGTTFAENARIKAEFYREKTGCACVADDSGLEVEVLGGAPGIHSARFAGFHADDATNNQKLLEELQKAGVKESPADYRCALVFADTDGTVFTSEGRCDGIVRMVPRGENGFGYDPYFYTKDYPGRTMAEISFAEKDKISHRGRALREMVRRLEEYLK